MLSFDAPVRQKTLGDRFANAFSSAAQEAPEKITEHLMGKERLKKQTEALSKITGEDLSGLGEKQLESIALQLLKNKGAAKEQISLQKSENLKSAISTVDRMKNLRSKGNLGRGSSITGFFGGETAKDRGEYEQLGKSLISFATTIPIRNRLEFEILSQKLYDPSIPDSEAEGVLDSMTKILNDSLSSVDKSLESDEDKKEKFSNKVKFSSKNADHVKKFKQLDKKFKGDQKKVNEALAKEFTT